MKPAARILRVVRPDYGGPRARRVLAALAEHHGAPDGEAVVEALIASGRLVAYGSKRGTTWGAPRDVRRRAAA